MNDTEDRAFWLEIRRGLLTMLLAIEKRYQVGRYEPDEKSLTRPNTTHR